jgi:putative protease
MSSSAAEGLRAESNAQSAPPDAFSAMLDAPTGAAPVPPSAADGLLAESHVESAVTTDAPSASAPVVGDSIRLHSADDSERRAYKLRSVKTGSEGVWVSIPDGFNAGDTVYLIQTRELTRRYTPVIPHNLGAFRRTPGRDHAPTLRPPAADKAQVKAFPEGLYVAVSAVEDLYVVQSSRPVRALLACNRKTIARLLAHDKPPVPFPPKELILVLDPYFPETQAAALADAIPRLIARGFYQFMLNNAGHIPLLRQQRGPLSLIAGPYLYVFNRFAASFVTTLGLEHFVSPLENNRQNLERTVDASRRSLAFVPVFAYPALFRIRASLGGLYDFDAFSDSHDEAFRLSASDEGSLVVPERPCSLVDKIPFLKEAGFGRFIIDFSGTTLKKAAYRDVMRAAQDAMPLPHTSRFNWKDGFYQQQES